MPIQDCPGKTPSPHKPTKREASDLDVRSPDEEDDYTFVGGIKEDKSTLAHTQHLPAGLQGIVSGLTGSMGSGLFDGHPKRAAADDEDDFDDVGDIDNSIDMDGDEFDT